MKKTRDLARAAKEADCVVIVTDHKAFRQMELEEMVSLMKENPVIVDGRRIIIDLKKAMKSGFIYFGVGCGLEWYILYTIKRITSCLPNRRYLRNNAIPREMLTKTVKGASLRVVYITLYPKKYPRVKKIATSLKDKNVNFQVLTPKVIIKLGNRKIQRIISALINYTSFLLQIFFAKADVYWITNSPDIFVLPLVWKKANYILDYRSPWPTQVKLEFGKGVLSRIAEYFTYTALKYPIAITTPSSTFLKDVKESGKRVYVIPNYPLKSDFKPNVSRQRFRELNGIKRDEKIVLFVGKLAVLEGGDILPSIVEELSKKTEKIALWIVGDGVLRSVMEQLEKNFPENVKFFGWRPHKEIPNFINAADVCIVPRHETPFFHYYNEENVHKISESMLFEKPIVSCGIAPSKEYLLVKRQDIVKGILEALEGKAPKPTPKTWEQNCTKKVLEVIEFLETLLLHA